MKTKIKKIRKELAKVKDYSVNNEISLKQEVSRKLHHLLIAILPISYFFVTKLSLLTFLAPIALLIILTDFCRLEFQAIGRVFNKVFGKILRKHEENKLCGATYFSIAALIIFPFFPDVIAINAFLILAISDSLAAIIGKKINSRPFFDKSIAGSAAFFISALLITTITGLIFNEKILYYLFSLIAIFVATIIEARPRLLDFDDNLTIPLSFSLIVVIFNTIWIYN